jgi:hypothetical protein
VTVPGCKPKIILFLFVLFISIEKFLMIIFKADLDALYEYQPPRKLSLILPTLADKDANLEILFLFNFGRKYFPINKVGRVLAEIILLNFSTFRSFMDFSGFKSAPIEIKIISNEKLFA